MADTVKTDSYNIDADQEFFKFTFKGHSYNFRYMTTDETDRLNSIRIDEATTPEERGNNVLNFLYGFITTDDKDAPDFKAIAKTMIIPEWKKFFNMIGVEFAVA